MNTQRIIEHYYSHAVNFKLPGIFSSTVTFLLSLGFKSELNALNFMVHFFCQNKENQYFCCRFRLRIRVLYELFSKDN